MREAPELPSTEGGVAVEARGVRKRFDDGLLAVEGLDAAIGAGEFVAFVGPSGCGKSTFLRLVSGLALPSGGELTVGGQAPRQRHGRRLAYVLQDPTLLRWRRVAANVALPLELRHLPRADIESRVQAALTRVGLDDVAGLYPHQLSGGMRMRVSIARALATDPGLLLMDEPFGALDEISRQRLNEDLQGLWSRRGFTCLFVTHNVQEAVFLSQRVIVLSARPARVVAVHEVGFPVPRDARLRSAAAFVDLVQTVSADLATTLAP